MAAQWTADRASVVRGDANDLRDGAMPLSMRVQLAGNQEQCRGDGWNSAGDGDVVEQEVSAAPAAETQRCSEQSSVDWKRRSMRCRRTGERVLSGLGADRLFYSFIPGDVKLYRLRGH